MMNFGAAKTDPGLVTFAFNDDIVEKGRVASRAYKNKAKHDLIVNAYKDTDEASFKFFGINRVTIKAVDETIARTLATKKSLVTYDPDKASMGAGGGNGSGTVRGTDLVTTGPSGVTVMGAGGGGGDNRTYKAIKPSESVRLDGVVDYSGARAVGKRIFAGASTGRFSSTKPNVSSPPQVGERVTIALNNVRNTSDEELSWTFSNPNIITKADVKNALALGLSEEEINRRLPLGVSLSDLSDGRKSSDGKEIITGDTVEGDDKPQTPDEEKRMFNPCAFVVGNPNMAGAYTDRVAEPVYGSYHCRRYSPDLYLPS